MTETHGPAVDRDTDQLIRDVLSYVSFAVEVYSGIDRVVIPVEHWDDFKEEIGTEWEGVQFVWSSDRKEPVAECKIQPGIGGDR